jgi:predicted SAM-dependent methyltransferase
MKEALKISVKQHTTYALRFAVHQLIQEVAAIPRHILSARKVRSLVTGHPVKLNIGCGPNSRPGWLNIDLFDSRADLRLDVRKRWPLPDGSVSYVYSEHVFEHLEFYGEVPHFLSESLRVLWPGGVFDVGVPDTEWPLQAYGNPHHPYWAHAPKWHPDSCKTQLDHINYHFRQGEQHKYAWDEETLGVALQSAGFTGINRREFNPELDSESRKIGTLYMRAVKPIR